MNSLPCPGPLLLAVNGHLSVGVAPSPPSPAVVELFGPGMDCTSAAGAYTLHFSDLQDCDKRCPACAELRRAGILR
jgi:hypothetical protein